MPFLPSASCRNLDLPPVNLRFLQSHLTKNAFAIAPTHLCGIALKHEIGAAKPKLDSSYLIATSKYNSRPPPRRKVAAALSAAVTSTKFIRRHAPNAHGRHQAGRNVPRLIRQPLFGRGGLGERRFSQRSGLSPRISPKTRLFGREREGGGFSTEKPPPSQNNIFPFTLQTRCCGSRG